MGLKGILISTTNQIINKVVDIFNLMGDSEVPEPNWNTLQNQHKVISNLLDGIGGGYRTSEDIIPEEHSFEKMYTIPDGIDDFTFDESGNLVFLKGDKAIVMNLLTYELISYDLNFGETVNQTWQQIEKCGSSFIVFRKKATYISSNPFLTRITENVNRVYVFNNSFVYQNKWNWDASNNGGIKGIGFDDNITKLRLLTYKPSASGGNDPGISAYYDKLYATNLSGEIDDSKTIDLKSYGMTYSEPPYINTISNFKLGFDSDNIYLRKSFFSNQTMRIWGLNNTTGKLERIIKLNDMLGDIIFQTGDFQKLKINSITYKDTYLYLLLELPSGKFIAKVKINE